MQFWIFRMSKLVKFNVEFEECACTIKTQSKPSWACFSLESAIRPRQILDGVPQIKIVLWWGRTSMSGKEKSSQRHSFFKSPKYSAIFPTSKRIKKMSPLASYNAMLVHISASELPHWHHLRALNGRFHKHVWASIGKSSTKLYAWYIAEINAD